ncbi:hypothetical protein C2U70_16550 [Bradyrhizobium guangdongense]|uniref:VWD domain-containing protein n=1 Tax=Bradyrhizobium guangdongense TaxID=1325090 RepID=UPI001FEEAC6D|nr:VWD domain-containing protein [Bradyrhizobium guangdongense]TPQ34652.1 hypothetical protein C2U70_16550 [Bradyrhizobium guangdongense]
MAGALLALAGLGAYLGWFHRFFDNDPPEPVPPVVAQVEPSSGGAPPAPRPTPIKGLIREVSERTRGTSNGDVHIRTIDGAYYDLQLIGEFVALKSTTDDMEVQVRQAPWQGTSRSISTNVAVAANVVGDRVGFYVGRRSGLYVNGQSTPLPDEGSAIALPKGGRVARIDGKLSMIWPDHSEIRVIMHSYYLDLTVDLANARAGKIGGLFGNFDGNAANDLMSRDGTAVAWPELVANVAGGQDARKALYGIFGHSWRIGQRDSLFDYDSGESTSTWTDLDFPYAAVSTRSLDEAARQRARQICSDAGITDTHFLDNCIIDVASTGDSQFTQSAMQAQEAVKLKVGFHCQPLPLGGHMCTNYEPTLPEARIGAAFKIDIETMNDGAKTTEAFDCTLIDKLRRASCTIRTKGRVFVGSKLLRQYALDNGETHKEELEMKRE